MCLRKQRQREIIPMSYAALEIPPKIGAISTFNFDGVCQSLLLNQAPRITAVEVHM